LLIALGVGGAGALIASQPALLALARWGGAAYAQGNQQGIRTGASQRNLQAMRTAHPLRQHKGVLRANRHNQAGTDRQPLKKYRALHVHSCPSVQKT
jgi:hypothetical protein